MFSRALIVVTSTLAYEVHWLRFQDLSLIGPATLKRRTRTKKVMNKKHLILHKKLMVSKTAITLQNTVFGSVCQVHPLDFTKFANCEQFHQSEMFSLSFFQLLPLFSAIPNAVFAQLEGWFFFALLIVE